MCSLEPLGSHPAVHEIIHVLQGACNPLHLAEEGPDDQDHKKENRCHHREDELQEAQDFSACGPARVWPLVMLEGVLDEGLQLLESWVVHQRKPLCRPVLLRLGSHQLIVRVLGLLGRRHGIN